MRFPAPSLGEYLAPLGDQDHSRAGTGLNKRQRRVVRAGLKHLCGCVRRRFLSQVAARRALSDDVVIDVAKSVQRCPTALNVAPCVVANSALVGSVAFRHVG